MRLIRFERIDKDYGPIGFYFGCHNCETFSEWESDNFQYWLLHLYNPEKHLPRHGIFEFYWTRDGLRIYKHLIRYLIRASDCEVRCIRKWRRQFFVVYSDCVQVGILVRRKPNRRMTMQKNAAKKWNLWDSYNP